MMIMVRQTSRPFMALFLLVGAATPMMALENFHGLSPMMSVPKSCVITNDFSVGGPLDKSIYKAQQGTRWEIKDGVLFGQPSTPEYQASKPDHKGLEPRIGFPTTPKQFMATYSIRYMGGTATTISPFMEYGHHVTRVRILPDGTDLLAEHDTLRVAANLDYKLVDGSWYHVMVEAKGEEAVIQFANGPILYAKHATYALPQASGSPGIGFAGARGGTIEIDNLSIWSIADEEQPRWIERRATFPVFEPVRIKEPKPTTEKEKKK